MKNLSNTPGMTNINNNFTNISPNNHISKTNSRHNRVDSSSYRPTTRKDFLDTSTLRKKRNNALGEPLLEQDVEDDINKNRV
jgi:hypothetical protein